MSSSRTVPGVSLRCVLIRAFALVVLSGCESLRTWALDIADDGTGGVVHELDADLGHATARAWADPLILLLLICSVAVSLS